MMLAGLLSDVEKKSSRYSAVGLTLAIEIESANLLWLMLVYVGWAKIFLIGSYFVYRIFPRISIFKAS